MSTVRLILVLVGLVWAGAAQTISNAQALKEYQDFKKKYKKKMLNADQEKNRQLVFTQNLNKIHAHNSKRMRSYEVEVNEFADLTTAEFVAMYTGFRPQYNKVETPSRETIRMNLGATTDIDWSTLGKVTPVRNQGSCGSCWAFSAIGAVESEVMIKRGLSTGPNLSEQQLVSCTRVSPYNNYGCNGGWMVPAFKFMMTTAGIATEAKYPYTASNGSCRTALRAYRLSGYNVVARDRCGDLLTALQTRPISVAVDATNWSSYRTGVFNNCAVNINHAVLLVGSTASTWRIKNSWGIYWGQSGFMTISKSTDCGICKYGSFPIL